eukprot:15433888-Alexandrium_andersonii.AAC.1
MRRQRNRARRLKKRAGRIKQQANPPWTGTRKTLYRRADRKRFRETNRMDMGSTLIWSHAER